MALIKCKECGKTISDKADACPECGFPLNAKEDKTVTKNESSNPFKSSSSIAEEHIQKKKESKSVVAVVVTITACMVIAAIILFSLSSKKSKETPNYSQQSTMLTVGQNVKDESTKILEIVDDYLINKKGSFAEVTYKIKDLYESIKSITKATQSEKDAKALKYSQEVLETMFDTANTTPERLNALLSARNSLAAMIGVKGLTTDDLTTT